MTYVVQSDATLVSIHLSVPWSYEIELHTVRQDVGVETSK
jgi:hypothetical protein